MKQLAGILLLFNTQIAGLLDKLKIQSPVAFLAILVIIFGGSSFVEHNTDLTDKLPWLFNGADEILKALAAILLNARTKRHMQEADDGLDTTSVMDVDHDD